MNEEKTYFGQHFVFIKISTILLPHRLVNIATQRLFVDGQSDSGQVNDFYYCFFFPQFKIDIHHFTTHIRKPWRLLERK